MNNNEHLEKERSRIINQKQALDAELSKLKESVKSGRRTSQEVSKSRSELTSRKSACERELRIVTEKIKINNERESLEDKLIKGNYILARGLLRDALQLLKDVRATGLNTERMIDFSNDVTDFLIGTDI